MAAISDDFQLAQNHIRVTMPDFSGILSNDEIVTWLAQLHGPIQLQRQHFLKPWVLVWPGSKPTTSCKGNQHSTTELFRETYHETDPSLTCTLKAAHSLSLPIVLWDQLGYNHSPSGRRWAGTPSCAGLCADWKQASKSVCSKLSILPTWCTV